MEEREEGVRVKVRTGVGDGSATQSKNIHMPVNEFSVNADFMVPGGVFQAINLDYFPCRC